MASIPLNVLQPQRSSRLSSAISSLLRPLLTPSQASRPSASSSASSSLREENASSPNASISIAEETSPVSTSLLSLPTWETWRELLPPILWAAPKKKTSHSKKRMRASSKGLTGKTNFKFCPLCALPIPSNHTMCIRCYSSFHQDLRAGIPELTRRQQRTMDPVETWDKPISSALIYVSPSSTGVAGPEESLAADDPGAGSKSK